MAEIALARRSPLASHADRFAAAGGDGTVRLREVPFLSMMDHYGAEPPEAGEGGATLPLGPDWWLLVGPPDAGPAAIGPPDAGPAAIGPPDAGPAAVGPSDAGPAATSADAAPDPLSGGVDVSAQRTTLELRGPRARDVLATGCALDLYPSVFPVGACAQTLLAQAQVVLHRAGPDTYRILVRTSYARYLGDWLLDAMVEHGED